MSEAEVEDGEETVDIEEQIKPFLFETEKELMSYSDAFEARARPFHGFSAGNQRRRCQRREPAYYENARFIIKGKQRRASDLVTVQCTAENIFVRSLDEEVRSNVMKYLKDEKGFKKSKKTEKTACCRIPA
ncbi:MAG: hypothetical protein CM15mP21_6200 [Hyphomicrobiales bacterium]|nr:MAG: hypothetical protein CM15mP21_6200 [Hyphomicrobiales bacterium]